MSQNCNYLHTTKALRYGKGENDMYQYCTTYLFTFLSFFLLRTFNIILQTLKQSITIYILWIPRKMGHPFTTKKNLYVKLIRFYVAELTNRNDAY